MHSRVDLEDELRPVGPRDAITRQTLRDGTFMERVRSLNGVTVPSDQEMDDAISIMLQSQPRLGPVWVFAYGSLMWNPAFEFEEAIIGTIRGRRRRFCLWTPYGRGTPNAPALTLALDNGGSTKGMAFRLPASREREELTLIWRREMFSGAYEAKWVFVEKNGDRFPALTFVADRSKPSYAGVLDDESVYMHILASSGTLGTGREYLEKMISQLEKMRVRDETVTRLQKKLMLSIVSAAPASAQDGETKLVDDSI